MPIDISEYAEPKFTRMKERHPLTEDSKDKFLPYSEMTRNYRDAAGFPQAGYNPNHNSTKTEKINLQTEDYSLKSR